MNDIDASDTRNWFRGAGFIPIGKDDSHTFQGNFDGNKKTIADLHIHRTSDFQNIFIGLFGYTERSTIKNLELKNVTIFGAIHTDEFYSAQAYVGGLVGQNQLTHHQRSPRRQPRRLRCQQQTPRHHRVGIKHN